MTKILGIDPGLSGALCLYEGPSVEPYLLPMPTLDAKKGRRLDNYGLASAFDVVFRVADVCYIEEVHAMPGQGVSSMFKFGRVFGALEMLVASYSMPIEYVRPTEWQAKMIGMGGKDSTKDRAVAKAIQMYPKLAHLFRTPRGALIDGNADALMIAVYGQKHRQEKSK